MASPDRRSRMLGLILLSLHLKRDLYVEACEASVAASVCAVNWRLYPTSPPIEPFSVMCGSPRLRWSVPYRVDIRHVAEGALDQLVELGAMDAECVRQGEIAALMPDGVAMEQVARALGVAAGENAPYLLR